jgi:hypothetical protein
MKNFLRAWARGVSICAYYFCLSIVVFMLGVIGEVLSAIVSIPVFIVFVPAVIYWVSKWLAPDLFPDQRPWWRDRFSRHGSSTAGQP